MNETLLLQKGQAFLALQPFSVLIGAELHALSPGHCELQFPIAEKILQQSGLVRGGVISYAADNALTYAGEPCWNGRWLPLSSESITSASKSSGPWPKAR
jgi:acyl-coenzyme A thioesterase PaaI-like protein